MFQKLLRKITNRPHQRDQIAAIRELIQQHPMESKNYFDIANVYSSLGKPSESLALLKSAQFLAKDGSEYEIEIIQTLERLGAFEHIQKRLELGLLSGKQCKDVTNKIRGKTDSWCFEALGYGKYQRLKMVSERIGEYAENTSVVDVGGGDGVLATVLEKNPYFIVDPGLNGLDGTKLPFDNCFFDLAVSCDVMEHIPKNLRHRYLDEMCRVAKKKVFITAPFGPSNRRLEEILFEIAENAFTEEHLEHEFSTGDEIKGYLNNKGLHSRFYPVSFEPLYLAISILNNKFFCDEPDLFRRFNSFVNREYAHMTSIEPSYTYLLEVDLLGVNHDSSF